MSVPGAYYTVVSESGRAESSSIGVDRFVTATAVHRAAFSIREPGRSLSAAARRASSALDPSARKALNLHFHFFGATRLWKWTHPQKPKISKICPKLHHNKFSVLTFLRSTTCLMSIEQKMCREETFQL